MGLILLYFEQCAERLRSIHAADTEEDKSELHEYLMQFQDEKSGKIDYQQLAMDLRGFNYDNETNLGIIPRSQRSISSGRMQRSLQCSSKAPPSLLQ